MISGFFLPDFIHQPLIQVAVQVPAFRPEWVVVTFVIDTGSSISAVHAADAEKVFGLDPADLDPARWASRSQTLGIGGSRDYFTTPASLALPREDGEWDIVEETLHFGERATGSTPALLGWNVLQHFELLVNSKQGVVRLTRL